MSAARMWLTSMVDLSYYLRIVVAMTVSLGPVAIRLPALTWAGSLALVVLALLLFGLGVYPVPLARMIGGMVGSLA